MWIRTFSSFFVLFSLAASAQFTNSQRVTIEDYATQDMAGADLDGDGDNDIIAVGGYGAVLLFENEDGAGHLLSRILRESGESSGTKGVDLVDVDNDGLLDIVIAREGGAEWWRNSGSLNFDTPQPFPSISPTPEVLFFSDLNQDGVPDVIFRDLNYFYFAYNQGGGQFSAPVQLFYDTQGTLNLLDLDGDGDDDLVISKSNLYMKVWRNDGAGVFTQTDDYGYNGNYNIMLVADMDQDGNDDLVFSGGGRWRRSMGDGTFSDLISLPPFTGSSANPPSFALKDIDNDGWPDFLGLREDQIQVLMGTGAGTFAAATNLTPLSEDIQDRQLHFIDVDGDGNDELFTVSKRHIRQYDFLVDGSLVFRRTINEGIPSGFCTIATTDLNGDGLLDVLRLSGTEGVLYAYLNQGPPGFGPPVAIITLPTPCTQFTLADMDADGDQDIILLNPPTMRVYENLGNMTFTQVSSDESSTIFSYVAGITGVADLDGDGDLDIIVSYSNRLHRFKNIGYTGTWAWQWLPSISPLNFPESPNMLGLLDVDEDGDLDIVVGQDQYVQWIPNTGGFSFGPRVNLVNIYASKMELQDMDADGDLDLLFLAPNISWSENLGGGQYGPAQLLATLPVPLWASYQATDVDHDGYPDVVGMGLNNMSAWYRNNGDGTLAPPHPLLGAPDYAFNFSYPQFVVSDLDGDGDEDLLYGTYGLNNFGSRAGLAWSANYASDPYHLTGTVFA
ncbi:MAG: VCBS repeat-containing protein, partial [Flavobacteriales bacterium]